MTAFDKSISSMLETAPATVVRTNDGGICFVAGAKILPHAEAIHLLNQIRDWYDSVEPSAIEQSNASPPPRNDYMSNKAGYVYLIHNPRRNIYKIGMALDPDARFKSLQTVNNHALKLIHTIPCSDYRASERHLHEVYAKRQTSGEWFNLTEADIMEIKGIEQL